MRAVYNLFIIIWNGSHISF